MRWGFPYAFLFLLGAVPLILLFHSLKPKGLRLRTSSLFLWERVLRAEPRGRRLSLLLQRNLLLVIQLLTCLLVVAALAEPFVVGRGSSAADTIVVLDLSASMKAKGRQGIRFETAREEFLKLIGEMVPNARMMVIGAGPRPEVLLPFTADESKLEEVARKVRPTDAPARVKDAILFALSFLGKGGGNRVFVLSDGAFDEGEELPWRSPYLRLVRVGGESENVGITAFGVRRVSAAPLRYELMLAVKNFAAHPVTVPRVISVGENVLTREKVDLKAKEKRIFIDPYRGPLDQTAKAVLDLEDGLASDNVAFAAAGESRRRKLLYLGRNDLFLSRLFSSFPDVEVTRGGREIADISSGYNVVVINGVPVPPLRRGNFILFNTLGGGLPLEEKGRILRPRMLPVMVKHPLSDGVRLGDVFIREARRVALTDKWITLAECGEGPLIFAFDRGQLKALVIAFDVSVSDFPYKVAFPLLVANALEWMVPDRAEFPASQVQAGMPYSIPFMTGDQRRVEIMTPSGKRETVDGRSTFDQTLEVGTYSYRTSAHGGQQRVGHFSVNLLSESESDIGPRPFADLPPAEVSTESALETRHPLWVYFVMAAFVLMTVEALLWFRVNRAAWA